MFAKLSLKQKLLFGLTLFFFGIFILAGINTYSLQKIQKNYQQIILVKDNQISFLEAFIGHLQFRNEIGKFQRDRNIQKFNVEKDYKKCQLGKFYYSEKRAFLEKDFPELKKFFSELEEPHIKLHESVEYLENLLFSGKREEAIEYYGNEFQKNLEVILMNLTSINKILEEKSISLKEEIIKNVSQIILLVIVLSLLSFVITLIFGYLFSDRLSKSLSSISSTVFSSSLELAKSGKEISNGSQNLASISSELASSIEEITSSMEELQSIIESNSKNINQSGDMTEQIKKKSEEANAQTEDLKKAMEVIVNHSKKIIKIIKIIEDIAFQTNILSLNAAVESARAGEAGKGFAVVAEQIKQLASKSSNSIKETSDLIEDIVKSVNEGMNQVNLTKENAEVIQDLANKIYVFLSEVSIALKEQTKGATQITTAISQINTQVQNIASISEENASINQEMYEKTSNLEKMVKFLNEIIFGKKNQQ